MRFYKGFCKPKGFICTLLTDRKEHVAAKADSSLSNRRASLSRSLATGLSVDTRIPQVVLPLHVMTVTRTWRPRLTAHCPIGQRHLSRSLATDVSADSRINLPKRCCNHNSLIITTYYRSWMKLSRVISKITKELKIAFTSFNSTYHVAINGLHQTLFRAGFFVLFGRKVFFFSLADNVGAAILFFFFL